MKNVLNVKSTVLDCHEVCRAKPRGQTLHINYTAVAAILPTDGEFK